jgi:hypothetical protein
LVTVVNLISNKLSKILGFVENTERFLYLALFQGKTKPNFAAGETALNLEQDPTLVRVRVHVCVCARVCAALHH